MVTQNDLRLVLWELQTKIMDVQRIFDSIDPEDYVWDDAAEQEWRHAEFLVRDGIMEMERIAKHVKAISDERKRARELAAVKE